MKGILARKLGMSQFISPNTGDLIPVTILEVPKNKILQVKTKEKDEYAAVVVGAFPRKNFGKNENKQYKFIKEIPVNEGTELKKGDDISVEILKEIKKVKVTGTSRGHGFSGVVKRHNFHGGPRSHGSTHQREGGSVGTCAKPARIMRGKKMAGQYGNVQITIRDVEIIEMDINKNLLALKGCVPGAKNGLLKILV